MKATEMLKRAKDTNMPIEEFVKQGDMFGDVDPVVAQMALFIKDNNRSPARMGEAFKAMADFLVKELEHQQNNSLFEDDKPVNMADVIKAANARLQKQYGEQAKTIGARAGGFIDIFTETRGQKADREKFLANKNEPEIDENISGASYKEWKKSVPHLGKANGWDLFNPSVGEKKFVLKTSYNSVGFDTETEAKEWAAKNKANSKGYFKKQSPTGQLAKAHKTLVFFKNKRFPSLLKAYVSGYYRKNKNGAMTFVAPHHDKRKPKHEKPLDMPFEQWRDHEIQKHLKHLKELGKSTVSVAEFLRHHYNEARYRHHLEQIAKVNSGQAPDKDKRKEPEKLLHRKRHEHGGLIGQISSGPVIRGGGLSPTEEQPYQDYGIKQSRGEITAKATTDTLSGALAGHLRPHQKDFVNLAIENYGKGFNSILNADGTGAGKTRQQLALAAHMLEQNPQGHVLIATENDRIIDQAFIGDAQAMGVPIKKIKTDGEMTGPGIYVCTYNRIGSGDIAKTPSFVIFDEAHNLKNHGSKKTKAAAAMLKSTKSALFTATPINVGEEVGYIATAFGMSYSSLMDQLGYEYKTIAHRAGTPIKGYELRGGVSKDDALDKVNSMFASLTKAGVMVKREVSLDNVSVDGRPIKVSQDLLSKAQSDYDALELKVSRLPAGERGTAKMTGLQMLRNNLESAKIPYAIEAVKKELAAGRQVVLFANRINDNEDSDGTLLALSKALDDVGIAHGKVFGKNLKDAKRDVSAFNAGETKVVIATPQGGGTGLSMDDTKGDAPRTMVIMTAPFSAMQAVQMMGRINRLNTRSDAKVTFLRTDTAIDHWNYGIIEQKLATLGASVAGDVADMNLSQVALDKFSDHAITEIGLDIAPVSANKLMQFKAPGFYSPETVANAKDAALPKIMANITMYASFIPQNNGHWPDTEVGFGKYNGKMLSQIKAKDADYFSWLMGNINVNMANVWFEGEKMPDKQVSNTKVYLNVPYDNKDTAKKHGAKWDGDRKKWYIIGDVPTPLERFMKSF